MLPLQTDIGRELTERNWPRISLDIGKQVFLFFFPSLRSAYPSMYLGSEKWKQVQNSCVATRQLTLDTGKSRVVSSRE